MNGRPVELTDLLIGVREPDGTRLPVRRDDVVAQLRANGQRRAARLAATLPARGEYLDPDAVDALLLRVHAELQRLGEELQLPRRMAETIRSWAAPLLAEPGSGPVRVVDVGCGLGHVVRWLAAHDCLGPRVELVGVDLNPALVAAAASLAELEGLTCRFRCGDAFAPGVVVEDPRRTIIVSTGLLHHIAPEGLQAFFAAHQGARVAAFAHLDVAPGPWATAGAWVFHRARMREPVSRHDGVLSARRAHPASVLRAAAAGGAPGYRVVCRDSPRWRPALVDVLRPVLGIRGDG